MDFNKMTADERKASIDKLLQMALVGIAGFKKHGIPESELTMLIHPNLMYLLYTSAPVEALSWNKQGQYYFYGVKLLTDLESPDDSFVITNCYKRLSDED